MSKGKAPTPPDPKETAAAQTGTNLATAQANAALGNVNQVTPYGSLTYEQTGQQFISDPNGQIYYRGPNGEIQSSAPAGQSAAPSTTPGSTGRNPFGSPVRDGSGLSRDGGNAGSGQSSHFFNLPGRQSAIPEGWTKETGYYVPTYTATQSLSPTQQQIFDQSQAAQINLAKLANNQSSFLNDYLGRPFDTSTLPAGGDASSLTMPQYQQFANGPQLQSGFDAGGDIQRQIADGGTIADGFDRGGQVATSFDAGGNIQSQVGDAGSITRDYGPNDGYAANVQAVQDAMFSRLNPQIDQQRAALETSLANRGIAQGSAAFDRAMQNFDQGVNDQRTSILLASGQEQSRLADLDAQRAGFQNAAQQQAYNQALMSGQFANTAQQQQFNQNAAQAQFGNTAQQQQFDQNAALAQFGNNAQQQRFNQNAAQGQFANTAQQQQFSQNQAQAAFQNDALQSMFANQNSTTAANNALQDSTLNAQLAQFNAANQQRTQALNEAYAARNQPLNEITSLLGNSQLTAPNFVNTNMPTIPTVDYAGLVNENYNQRLGAWQQQQAGANNILGGLFGLGSSMIMASDRRVKKDIKKRGEIDGLGVYEYRYKGEKTPGKRIGLMAQEVERKTPEAVIEIGGVKHVDYPKALSGLLALGQEAA